MALSSGKQSSPTKEGAGLVEIDPNRELVGIAVSFYMKGLNHREIPYMARLTPMYSPEQAIRAPFVMVFSIP